MLNNSFYQFPDSIGPNKNKRQSKWQTDIGTKNAIHKTFEFGAKKRNFKMITTAFYLERGIKGFYEKFNFQLFI